MRRSARSPSPAGRSLDVGAGNGCSPGKLVARDHNDLSELNQSLTDLALFRHCTLWTGGNPLWSPSEIGFVPHLAWGSRHAIVRCRSPLPGSRRPQSPIGAFWLRSVILASRSVSAGDCRQVSCSPAHKCRLAQACLRFYMVKSFTFNIGSRILVPAPSGRRILPKTPSRCVSRFRANTATH